MNKHKLQLYFFLLMLLGALLLAYIIFQPYLGTLILAATVAIALQPVYVRLLKFTGGMRRAAALITMALAIIVIMVPAVFLSFRILEEALNLYTRLSSQSDAYTRVFQTVNAFLAHYLPGLRLDFSLYASQFLNWLVKNLGALFSGTVITVFNLFIGLVALFYFLVDGKRFMDKVVALSPLADGYDKKIALRLEAAVTSVLRGSLLIALIQGLFSGFGLWLFGVPDPSLWGCLAAVAALIPGVGTSLVLIPAIIYLFAGAETWQALGLLLWSATAVGLIDNALGPHLVGRGVHIHPFFILLSVLGGIAFFGPLGFLFGPLALSLLYGLLEIYPLLVLGRHK